MTVAEAQENRESRLDELKRQCDTELEKKWLDFLDSHGYRLPSHAQKTISQCGTRPDFYYEDKGVAIYIDGPVHEFSDRARRDAEQEDCLADMNVTVLRFTDWEQWQSKIEQYSDIFRVEI